MTDNLIEQFMMICAFIVIGIYLAFVALQFLGYIWTMYPK